MPITLRPYQVEAMAAIEADWSDGLNRPAVVLPTGAGKTSVFTQLIADRIDKLRANGLRVLLLAHRETLLEQAEERIKQMAPGVWTAVVKGSRGKNTHQFADVIVASVQTMARPARRESVDRIGMVIVDECHLAASKSYRDVLAHYGCFDERQTPTVGFTATLTRMAGGLPDVWQSVAYQKKIHWMIKEGYLVPPVARSVDTGLNLATARVTGGDLNAGDLSAAMMDSAAFDIIADTWLSSASERPTIAFLPDVKTTERLRDAFLARGVTSESVIGATPATERRAVFARYNSGATQVLTSCMTLTEGFDAPATSCVIIGRPTINPGLYIQMVGRGLRLAPGKTDCLVLDIAGASLRHTLAGVNDLESDCEARCDCGCLTCGCSDRCKCGIQRCACLCVEQHEAAPKCCRDASPEGCGCGCTGEQPNGSVHCVCERDDSSCECYGEGPVQEVKEVAAESLKNLVDVDIMGAELASSPYTWLSTTAGIRFLAVGHDVNLFLLPDPDSDGFFQGMVSGTGLDAGVKRLDHGAVPAADARAAMESYAADSGFSYNSRKASWRRGPASQAQVGLLRRLGVVVPDGLTKGGASDLLSVTKTSRVLDHRFGRYARATDV